MAHHLDDTRSESYLQQDCHDSFDSSLGFFLEQAQVEWNLWTAEGEPLLHFALCTGVAGYF